MAPALMAAPHAGAAAARERVLPAQTSWTPPPPQAPAKEGMADLPGVRLSYWDTGGAGEPIVFLHPATGSAGNWAYQQPVFAKAGYRVIAYSRRGHGKSERGPADDTGTGSGDLHGLIEWLKLDRVHLLGSAAGGFIPIDYALSHPERVRSIVIASSLGGVQDPDYIKSSQAMLPPGWMALPPEFRELGPSYRFANPEGVKAWLELEHAALSGKMVLQGARNPVLLASLAKIAVPTFFLTGDADLYQPPARMRLLAAALPGSELAIIPEAGHATHWEQPQAFNRAVLEFIAKHRANRA